MKRIRRNLYSPPCRGTWVGPHIWPHDRHAQQKLGVKVIAIYPDGSQMEFDTMLDAAKACNMNVGSIASVIKTGGTCRNGMKFQKI